MRGFDDRRHGGFQPLNKPPGCVRVPSCVPGDRSRRSSLDSPSQSAPDLRPRYGANHTGIQFGDAFPDFLTTSLAGFPVNLRMKAVEQRIGQRSSCLRRKGESLLENLVGVLLHHRIVASARLARVSTSVPPGRGRMREVIERAAGRFGWWGYKGAAGMACNLEKDAHMALFAEVDVRGAKVRVVRMTMAFDCGAVLNPDYLRNQAIVHTRGADNARMGPSAEGRTRIPGVPTPD